MVLSAEEKAWREQAKTIYDNDIPSDLKSRFEALIQGSDAWAEKSKQHLVLRFEDGGLDEAIAYVERMEQVREESRQKQEAEIKEKQEWERIAKGVEFNPAAYKFILNQAQYRLEGKEHASKRPHLGLRFDLKEEGFMLTFTPVLKSSPTGWVIDGIETEFRPYVGIQATIKYLKASLTEQGVIRCTGWRHAKQGTIVKLVGLLQIALNDLASSPERLFEGSCQCCCCGKPLTDAISKARGIGPECGRFIDTFFPDMEGDRHA